jgi:hypothetical protein
MCDLPTRVFGALHGFEAEGPGTWSRSDGRLRSFLFSSASAFDFVVTYDGHTTRWTHHPEQGPVQCATYASGSPCTVCSEAVPEVTHCMNCGTPCLDAVECSAACAALLRNDNVFP